MAEDLNEFQQRCAKSVEHFKKELTRLRTGRASTGLLEGISVEYYGSSVPLVQLGMVAAPEPRLLTIQVYDRAAVESVEKAILQADLGLNPSRDGTLIRLAIPPLTEERRKELVKRVHKMAEDAKVVVRGHRRDIIDVLKKQVKEKEISEDDMHRQQEEVQKITDRAIADLDQIAAVKEKEVMEV